MKRALEYLAVITLAAITLSCKRDHTEINESDRNVLILYSAGFNNIHKYLSNDIERLKEGYVPTKGLGKDVILVVTKPVNGSTSVQTAPEIIQLYTKGKEVIAETVKTYEVGDILASASMMHRILTDILTMYPARNYGMIFSSHATGWLPKGYYSTSDAIDLDFSFRPSTLGQEDNNGASEEIELGDMVTAIPMHLDYLVIDACLSGCIEVAYALKGNTDYIAFSPAEVLTNGYDYTKIAQRLLKEKSPEAVCSDILDYYSSQSGIYRSSTISLVKTSELRNLAAVCKPLFEKYRAQIAAIDYTSSGVQTYFGGTKHWFFDLEDILLKAGITEAEKATLEEALNRCIVYKGTTGQYYSSSDSRTHQIVTYSGVSMYLPSAGSEILDNFYRLLTWNYDTHLVEYLPE